MATVAAAFVIVPLAATAARVDWSHLPGLLTRPETLTSLSLSLRTSLAATVACLMLGAPLGLWLARTRWRLVSVVRAIVLAPLVLPPVVSGLALLFAFGRQGLLGRQLDLWGAQIAFSTTAVVLAQTFVALPFMVLAVESAAANLAPRAELLAATLGGSPTMVLRRITIPALAPAMATGTVLTFARALGEFGATLTFAGSLPGVTRTAPLEIYLQREVDPDQAVALALVLLVVAVAVVAVAYRPIARTARPQAAPSRSTAAAPSIGSGSQGGADR